MLIRSALARPTMLGRLRTLEDALNAEVLEGSLTWLLRTLNGRLSRLPPYTEDGARARTDALVSREFRRRRFEEDASVRIEALSVSIPFAVAV